MSRLGFTVDNHTPTRFAELVMGDVRRELPGANQGDVDQVTWLVADYHRQQPRMCRLHHDAKQERRCRRETRRHVCGIMGVPLGWLIAWTIGKALIWKLIGMLVDKFRDWMFDDPVAHSAILRGAEIG